MSVNLDVQKPIDRVLSWLEHVVPAWRRYRQRRELLKIFESSGKSWLTLGLLTRSLGLNDQEESNLDSTAHLLVTLPAPGPARPDQKPENRNKPRSQQLRGLADRVGR